MAFEAIRHLLARRVPQIVGLYLGASWVIIEFIDMLIDRFALSPHLIELCMVLLGAMIPTVILLAYFHGAPGPNEWHPLEKVGIPVNLVAAVALVGTVFADKPLGAVTTTVLLEDEQGQTIERVIPKGEFRKKLALFGFENRTGDPESDWLQKGLGIGLYLDLEQDLYISLAWADGERARLQRVGYPDGVGMPIPLMARLAEEMHRDYFVTGWVTQADDVLSVNVALYETRRQRLLKERTHTGSDPLRLIDDISVQLRRDLEIPERHIEDTVDLRVADILTHSREAFRLLVLAIEEVMVRNDWDAASSLLERAVVADPTSVFAQYELATTYLILNRREEADAAAKRALDHLYRLPDRWQFDIKYFYYANFEEDADKRFAVAKMKTELFPDDIQGHAQLAKEYANRNLTAEQIAEYERILELDPTQYDYLRWIGNVYKGQREFDKALDYFRRYAQAVPNDHTGFEAMGDLYVEMGEHERAKSFYERALIIDSDNVRLMNALAVIAFNTGDFDGSGRQHLASLEAARTAEDSAYAYGRLSYHYETRGQLDRALEYRELQWSQLELFRPPAIVLSENKVPALALYAQTGRQDEAFAILEQAERQLAAPFTNILPVGYLETYLALEDVDRAEEALAEVEVLLEETDLESQRDEFLEARGRIHELRGEYEAAIADYRGALELAPADFTRYRAIGRCYRLLGQLGQAEDNLKRNLQRTPYNPKSHYQLARLYAEMGDRERALEHLQISLEVWSQADPGFKPAREARSLAEELEPAVATSP